MHALKADMEHHVSIKFSCLMSNRWHDNHIEACMDFFVLFMRKIRNSVEGVLSQQGGFCIIVPLYTLKKKTFVRSFAWCVWMVVFSSSVGIRNEWIEKRRMKCSFLADLKQLDVAHVAVWINFTGWLTVFVNEHSGAVFQSCAQRQIPARRSSAHLTCAWLFLMNVIEIFKRRWGTSVWIGVKKKSFVREAFCF